MLKKYEKWFKFREDGFDSIKGAKTFKKAWDKTDCKWEILFENPVYYHKSRSSATCGLCDLSRGRLTIFCEDCPIAYVTGHDFCENTPIDNRENLSNKETIELEYLFLLFVKEATFNNKW